MIKQTVNIALNKDSLFLASVLLIMYLIISVSHGYLQNVDDTMFWSRDAMSYREVSDWLCGIKNTEATSIRPFLYPLIVCICRSIAGNHGIWFYHLLIWMVSGVILYHSVKKMTQNRLLAMGSGLIYTSNLSLMVQTFHAVTELTVIFLLTILIALIVNKSLFDPMAFWIIIFLVTSLLTVVKPVYCLLLIWLLIYRLPFLIARAVKSAHMFRILCFIVIALSPVILQLSIMKLKHNKLSLSNIGVLSAKNYFLPMVYVGVYNISLPEARETTKEYSHIEAINFIFKHSNTSIRAFGVIIRSNLISSSELINIPDRQMHLYTYMKFINKSYTVLHVIMMPTLLFLIFFLFKNKQHRELETVFFLMIPLYMLIITSGISYFQGDRIILPTLPVWITLYTGTIANIRRIVLMKKFTKRTS